jgi:hypothetical protein
MLGVRNESLGRIQVEFRFTGSNRHRFEDFHLGFILCGQPRATLPWPDLCASAQYCDGTMRTKKLAVRFTAVILFRDANDYNYEEEVR